MHRIGSAHTDIKDVTNDAGTDPQSPSRLGVGGLPTHADLEATAHDAGTGGHRYRTSFDSEGATKDDWRGQRRRDLAGVGISRGGVRLESKPAFTHGSDAAVIGERASISGRTGGDRNHGRGLPGLDAAIGIEGHGLSDRQSASVEPEMGGCLSKRRSTEGRIG